ncbi:MAG: O-antigen ligase family protein [Candidatus Pacebacteria bacterium]|nr:O-antigen ligase family protein [Candidatus Paceibacterota bacterium]
MKNLTQALWLSEFALALLIITGVADATMAYISLFVLLFGIWKLSNLEALRLYIYSIPIFVTLPPSVFSEAMSVWRFALLFFVFKIFLERFEILATFRNRGLTFKDKKSEIYSRFGDFIAIAKTSNYYGILYPTVLFGIIGILSLFSAQSLGAGVKKMVFLGSVFLLFSVVSFAVRKKEDVEKVLKSVFASGVGILAIGYLQLGATFGMTLYDFWGMWDKYVIQAFYGERTMHLLSYSNTWFSYYDASGEIPPTLRMFSVMPDSHSFSMLMIIFIPFALFYAFAAKKKSVKAKYLAVLALMFLAIYFSGSRGAWVGWLGALAVALYFYLLEKMPRGIKIVNAGDYAKLKNVYKKALGAMLIFIVIIPVASLVLNLNQDSQLIREGRMLSAEQKKNALLHRTWSISDMEETSNKGRMEIWGDSANSVIRHPLLGIGIGNFPFALEEKIGTSKMGASAHNIYLDIAVEMGLAGALIFLWMSWKIAEKLFLLSRKFKEERFRLLAFSILLSFVWICAYGLFDVVILNDKVLMFIVIILAVLYKLEDLEERESVGKTAL